MTPSKQITLHAWLSVLLVAYQPALASLITLSNNSFKKIGVITENNESRQKITIEPGEKSILFGDHSIHVNRIYYETGWESSAVRLDVCYLNFKPIPVSTIQSDSEENTYIYFYTLNDLDFDGGPILRCDVIYEQRGESSNEESDKA